MTEYVESEGWLRAFIEESNRIEGIFTLVSVKNQLAMESFLRQPKVTINALAGLVSHFQPGAIIRDQAGLDVRVGNHVAPLGGPLIRRDLGKLLKQVNKQAILPWTTHHEYESLHPFTDGNGRSGRALWLWQAVRDPKLKPQATELGFLHTWYYESLRHRR